MVENPFDIQKKMYEYHVDVSVTFFRTKSGMRNLRTQDKRLINLVAEVKRQEIIPFLEITHWSSSSLSTVLI